VAAALAVGYRGAGTVEFIVDADLKHYFLEMNTRLQVEHPVTECITGLDLVEWQLRIAAGEPLPLAQDQVRFQGHAIEVRLCAEDALHNFMPQSGTMAAWAMPEALRVEHALRPGDEIPPYYDSMIAKLVAHGATRAEALRRLQRGLQDAVALGVTTNQAFLSRCLAHPVFAQGGATTAFIGDHQAELLAGLTKDGDGAGHRRAAALAALLLHLSAGDESPASQGLTHRMPMLERFTLDGVACQGALTQAGPQRFATRLDGEDSELELVALSQDGDAGRVRVRIGGLADTAVWQREGTTLRFHFAGRAWVVVDASRAAAAQAGDRRHHDGKLRASMNGRVVALLVAVGDEVSAGQPLLTLEAMKMEHVHTAPRAGRVAALHVSLGDQVASHRVVAEIEAPHAAAPAQA
jgi:geranyl-CoA carboxylase alpha subunit